MIYRNFAALVAKFTATHHIIAVDVFHRSHLVVHRVKDPVAKHYSKPNEGALAFCVLSSQSLCDEE